MIDLIIDGRGVEVSQGVTILDACRSAGVPLPTLCHAPNLTPANTCRICVVEVQGSRVLVAACSRVVEPGMVVFTRSERVDHSRRTVLELLASSVDLSAAAAEVAGWMEEYGADPARYSGGMTLATQTVKLQDDLYVRDYAKCILCYRCVDACGDDAQHTYAIAVSGRGFEAVISTEFDVSLPDSACVYCGNCVATCPTGALLGRVEWDLRRVGDWRPEDQTVTRTVCPFCGVGCNLDVAVQDGRIVRVDSPIDHDVTAGHLCVKGRFGWQHVHLSG
ncbi:MAG: 2Fe-2S iron-sulfur cluster-binding protein [Acidimicrobiia bacterium]